MAETEVESILREIRERVLSQQRASQGAAATTMRAETANGSNGSAGQLGDSENVAPENLALINSHLTTTARAWDRLPPLLSNRSGFVARLELWLKRRLKAATHWFTWEQVNFNAAAHHALRDLLQVLSTQAQELTRLRTQIKAEADHDQTELAAQGVELETQKRTIETLKTQTEARLAELVNEMRQRVEHLQEEQRVCLKQLALESSETAVLEDRARRKAEALLSELQRRIEQIEKGKH